MTQLVDEAVVLDSRPFRDRHELVDLLTRHRGVMRGVLRSARGGRAPLRALTQVLSHIRVSAFQGARAELATFREVDLVRSSYPLATSLERAAAAAAVAEMLLTFCPPGEVAVRQFRLALVVLDGLLQTVEPDLAVAYAQLWILVLAGVLPPLDTCAACGAELRHRVAVRLADGQGLCHRCATGSCESFSELAIRFLTACRNLPLSQVPGPVPPACSKWLDAVARREAERPMHALTFLRRHLGHNGP